MHPAQSHRGGAAQGTILLPVSAEGAPTVLFLNQTIRTLSMKPDFNVESMIAGACASLITYEERGEALPRKRLREPDNQSAGETDTDTDVESESDSESLSEQDEASESDEDEFDSRIEECEGNTLVKLCHASLGDYLRREDLETSDILFGPGDRDFNVLHYTLRVACAGSSAPKKAWLDAVYDMWDRLGSLDALEVAPVDAVKVVECLHEFFCSEPLSRHIAQVSSDNIHSYDSLIGTLIAFFDRFSRSDDDDYSIFRVIREWIRRTHQAVAQLKTETKLWMEALLQSPHTLLVPIAKTCARELFAAEREDSFQLHLRYQFAAACYSLVSHKGPSREYPAQPNRASRPLSGLSF